MKHEIHVVAAILVNEKKEVLAGRKKPGIANAGFWEFPGGKQEADELPETALKREIAEELGIQIDVESLFGTYNYETPTRIIVLHCYRCSTKETGAITSNDHDEVGWFSKSELKELKFAPADLAPVEQIMNYEL